MREIRPSGSEGGGHELNPVSLPLFQPVATLSAVIDRRYSSK